MANEYALGVGVPVYLDLNFDALVLDQKGLFSGSIAGQASYAVATPLQVGGLQMMPNSILTLPNGAKYDVNQTYGAPTTMQPLTVNVAFLQNPDFTYDQAVTKVKELVAILGFDNIGERALVVLKMNDSTWFRSEVRLQGHSITWDDGFAFKIARLTINLLPYKNGWTITPTLAG